MEIIVVRKSIVVKSYDDQTAESNSDIAAARGE